MYPRAVPRVRQLAWMVPLLALGCSPKRLASTPPAVPVPDEPKLAARVAEFRLAFMSGDAETAYRYVNPSIRPAYTLEVFRKDFRFEGRDDPGLPSRLRVSHAVCSCERVPWPPQAPAGEAVTCLLRERLSLDEPAGGSEREKVGYGLSWWVHVDGEWYWAIDDLEADVCPRPKIPSRRSP